MAKIAIVQFPGSNCERETRTAVERAGMEAYDVLWTRRPDLDEFDGYILIGGFSYEDRCRAGFVASQDPIIDQLAHEAQKGKPVLGICNGAQVLVESGLIPGFSNRQTGMALTVNKRMQNHHIVGTGYYNTWCYIQPKYYNPEGAFDRYFHRPLHVPLAHAEGRFIIPRQVLNALEENGSIIWQYCTENGVVDHHFPVNPNGSTENIAAISNPAGNILAAMPHPERTRNGDPVFDSMRDYIEEQNYVAPQKISVGLNRIDIEPYKCAKQHCEVIIAPKGLDNEAMTLEQTLRHQGFNCRVKRYSHWEISSSEDTEQTINKIQQTNELLNPLSEKTVSTNINVSNSYCWLVRDKANIHGHHKHELLESQYGMTEIESMHYSVIWQIISEDGDIKQTAKRLTRRNFFFNPFAHEYYSYE